MSDNPAIQMSEDAIEVMVNRAVDAGITRATEILTTAIESLEQRMAIKYVSRDEYETLAGKVNALPPKLANATDVEDVLRELDKVKAENGLLKTQVTQAIGGQAEIQNNVRNMRESAEKVERQGIKMETTSAMLMGALEDNRATMRGIHTEQENARTERKKLEERVENLAETVVLTERWIVDTDKRTELALKPLYDYIMGSPIHPGIPKMFTKLEGAIESFRLQYQKDREADKPILERAQKGQQMQSAFVQFIWKSVFTKQFLGWLFAGGSIGAAILAVFGS
jgi:hypothetical protein